jgi:hypothetical protein
MGDTASLLISRNSKHLIGLWGHKKRKEIQLRERLAQETQKDVVSTWNHSRGA